MVAAIAIAGFFWLALTAGADARRSRLADDVRSALGDTSAAVIASELESSEGVERLASATDIRPGYIGRVGETDVFEARYSTQFFGFDRCVFARWGPAGFTLENGAGRECTEFRDRPPDTAGQDLIRVAARPPM